MASRHQNLCQNSGAFTADEASPDRATVSTKHYSVNVPILTDFLETCTILNWGSICKFKNKLRRLWWVYLDDVDSDEDVYGVVAGETLEQTVLRISSSDGRVLDVRWKRDLVDLQGTLERKQSLRSDAWCHFDQLHRKRFITRQHLTNSEAAAPTNLEFPNDPTLVVFGVASFLAAVQLERVQPFREPTELSLRLQLIRITLQRQRQ